MPPASGSVTDQDEFDRFYIRTTNPFISGRWNDSYTAIARYNTILDKIGAVTMDEALKNRYIAETKFLRALVYFNLVRTFGDVPLILKSIANPDEGYDYGRSPKADVYAQIEKDLTDFENVLPVSYPTAEIGRATKGAAKGLLGNVYLTEKKYAQATGDALANLNKIRTRAGLANKTATDIPSQQAFRLAMEQERRVKFAFEGQRWYDLVRTDRAITVLNGKKDQIRLVNTLSENNLVDPIPQSQIGIKKTKNSTKSRLLIWRFSTREREQLLAVPFLVT